MVGVVDVGGGMRAVYGAGVFDYCLDRGIRFDYGIGVSAGGANIISYLAGQRGRNYRFYTEYSLRKEYMGVGRFLKTGNYIDLDYIYGTLTNSDGEDPLDYDAVMNSDIDMCIVATDAESGEAVYYAKKDYKRDDYGMIKGSCCVPIADRPYRYRGRLLYDGGLSDPIPLEKALAEGCDRVVVILTRPRDYAERETLISFLIRKKYPKAAKGLSMRAKRYNAQLALCKRYESEGKVLIVAPDDIGRVRMLSKNRNAGKYLYEKGYRDAEAISRFLKRGRGRK